MFVKFQIFYIVKLTNSLFFGSFVRMDKKIFKTLDFFLFLDTYNDVDQFEWSESSIFFV